MKDYKTMPDVAELTGDEVVPYYANLIFVSENEKDVIEMNNKILSKWSSSGLEYIKDKAWNYLT